MPILVATTNLGKIKEIARVFRGLDLKLTTVLSVSDCPPHKEEGTTFEENAVSKARHYFEHTGLPSMADDSGLEVDALGGEPGVFSARYAGETAGDRENVDKLLAELRDLPPKERSARFRCVAAIVSDAGMYKACGTCEGTIAAHPVGDQGFGYDPVFVPRGFGLTFGELGTELKLTLSHRTRAFLQLRDYVAQNMGCLGEKF